MDNYQRSDHANTNRNDDSSHLVRQRVNALMAAAAKKAVTVVCAGAGCGKTRAVFDFLQNDHDHIWISLSEQDNLPARLWENLTDSVMRVDAPFADICRDIGFPDTPAKMDLFSSARKKAMINKPYAVVWDDFHLLTEPKVLHFAEEVINGLFQNQRMFLLCRDLPKVNINALSIKGHVSDIREEDLNFTESELSEYLVKQKLPVDSHAVREIYNDTKGWTFAVNLAARSLKRAPNYFGYVKKTLKQNIFDLMEAENWSGASGRLKHFWAKLSLIDHLSAELIDILADGDEGLLTELRRHNAYIRFDAYGGTYLIHHLFFDYLQTKQGILSVEEKKAAYKAAADWCRRNNFQTDALGYYEKVGEYDSIVSIFLELPMMIPYDIAQYAKGIFERAPAEIFDKVTFFAAIHINILARLSEVREFAKYADIYERRFRALPKDDGTRGANLCGIYFCLGMVSLTRVYDGKYDFDVYFTKMFDCMTAEIYDKLQPIDFTRAPWSNLTFSSLKSATGKFIEAVIKSEKTAARFSNGVTAGADHLVQGELLYYQGNLKAAEPLMIHAAENARKRMAFDTAHRALLYLMRIAVAEGSVDKAENTLGEIETLLEEKKYYQRFISYDIACGWYQYILRQPELFPRWLKERFSPYTHASITENFGNQVKARYCYLTRNYMPLLIYIRDMKNRESFIYGRLEMLAIEACVHYKMKNKTEAWHVLREAYEEAAPNEITMPFIELGKDMRTLAIAALRSLPDDSHPGIGIPRPWLEFIKHKATSYAKNHSKFVVKNKMDNNGNVDLSPREMDVLTDLYHGFTQAEIASKKSLSINTVKMVTKSIYEKLDVHKISDLVRIAAERGLV